MTVVSFDEWKKKKQRGSAYNARGRPAGTT